MSSVISTFTESLPVFKRFEALTDFDRYKPVPNDWLILITDVENSTRAIENGRYKPVNFCGVALLALLKNYSGNTQFPFLFGGDGATASLPEKDFHHLKPQLMGLKNMARHEFDLNLRIGTVPLKTIREQGYDVKVGLYRASKYYHQACFTGGGLAYAENLIKSDENVQLQTSNQQDTHSNNYEGLECRWNHLPARDGTILSLLVQANPSASKTARQIYTEVIHAILDIYQDFKLCKPLDRSQLTLTYQPGKLSIETKARSYPKKLLSKTLYMLKLWLQNVLGMLFMNFDMETGDIIWGDYKRDLVRNSDYRKFDDTLRMVLNSSKEQSEALRELLTTKQESGELYFGMHHSTHALITCLITHRNKDHIHFVDGSDGGYAEAAREMKEQMTS